MKKHTMIKVVLFFVVSIVLAAFVLSFRTVSAVGDHFFPGFGWLFALLIDAGMIVLGLVRLLAGVMRQQLIKRWAVAGLSLALAASFVLNIVTTDGRFTGEWLHWLAHGLPPVALLALSELALQIYDASRETAVSPYDKLMAKATAVLMRWRKRLAKQRRQLAELTRHLETVVSEHDAAMAKADKQLANLAQQLETVVDERDVAMAELNRQVEQLTQQLKTVVSERDAASKENSKLLRQLENDYIDLSKLPERLAYTAVAMSNGRVPNGDFVDKFGVGETTTNRAMAVMWPKDERPSDSEAFEYA